jgi:anti-repressor protein
VTNLPQVFKYEGTQVRTVVMNEQPWFVAKDVCDILELGNPAQALNRLDHDEKDIISNDTLGGEQAMLIVNEPGLYSLILGSRKPEARVFKRWVTHDVLPAIRRTGSYSVSLPRTFAEALRLAADQAEQIESQQKMLTAAQPKVEFYDAVTDSRDAIPIGNAAKVLGIPGIGRNTLFAILREKGVLMSGNIPMQEHIDRGRFRVVEQKWTTPEGETRISIRPLVYQKGLDYIRRLLTCADKGGATHAS